MRFGIRQFLVEEGLQALCVVLARKSSVGQSGFISSSSRLVPALGFESLIDLI
jgi:hypothetical protein